MSEPYTVEELDEAVTKHTKEDPFVVDFDRFWPQIGFTRRDNAVHTLKRSVQGDYMFTSVSENSRRLVDVLEKTPAAWRTFTKKLLAAAGNGRDRSLRPQGTVKVVACGRRQRSESFPAT